MENTCIQYLGEEFNCRLYIKRDDLIPFSFGGNKARKAELFFAEIDSGDYDCVVSYGGSMSNHCRVVSNMAAARNIPTYIISPESYSKTYNGRLISLLGASVKTAPRNNVHNAIQEMISDLKSKGNKPYFIPGGGHGILGTQAYVNCYEEIREYEQQHRVYFDYIFHASGTGTTQAGLICGKFLNQEDRSIIGISIARNKSKGRNVVLSSVYEYLNSRQTSFDETLIDESTIFEDCYVGKGYGKSPPDKTIIDVFSRYGIPLDGVYTGKAFYGMRHYIKKNKIKSKDILFLHTGGAPLFFDFVASLG